MSKGLVLSSWDLEPGTWLWSIHLSVQSVMRPDNLWSTNLQRIEMSSKVLTHGLGVDSWQVRNPHHQVKIKLFFKEIKSKLH